MLQGIGFFIVIEKKNNIIFSFMLFHAEVVMGNSLENKL